MIDLDITFNGIFNILKYFKKGKKLYTLKNKLIKYWSHFFDINFTKDRQREEIARRGQIYG